MPFGDLTTPAQKNLIIKLVEELFTGKYKDHFEGASDRGRWQIYLIGKEKEKNKEIGNFKDPERLEPNQEYLSFEEMDLDILDREGYISLDKRKYHLRGLLENKAKEEYKQNQKQELSSVSSLKGIRETLNEAQFKILTEIWMRYLQNNEWIPTRLLHHKFEKNKVISAVEPLGGSIVCETHQDTKIRYMLTLLGILLTEEGEKFEQLIIQYLEYVKNRFQKDPSIETITSGEIEASIKINERESRILGHLINIGHFYGGGMSSGHEKWDAELPEDVDEFYNIDDFHSYIHKKAMKHYDPDLSVWENERRPYPSTKEKPRQSEYINIEFNGNYENADWQGLFNFLLKEYDPLSLRSFNGTATPMVSEYARKRWFNDGENIGFGELMIKKADNEWKNFKFRFFDQWDVDRYLEANIDCLRKSFLVKGNLDNTKKLIYAFENIIKKINPREKDRFLRSYKNELDLVSDEAQKIFIAGEQERVGDETLAEEMSHLIGEISEEEVIIERSIEFPPEYHQAGISILTYFGTVLRNKYPDKNAKVRIEQEGLKVTMIVETEEGEKEAIEQALDDYGLVVVGKKQPEDITEDKFKAMELSNELRLAAARIESQKELLQYQNELVREKNVQIDKLFSIIEQAVQSPSRITIEASSKAETYVSQEMQLFWKIFPMIQREISELMEQVPKDSDDAEAISEIQESLKNLEKSTPPGEIKKSPFIIKLKNLIDDINDEESRLNKTIKTIKNGVENAQRLAGYYNDIAQWLSLPQVPKPFIK